MMGRGFAPHSYECMQNSPGAGGPGGAAAGSVTLGPFTIGGATFQFPHIAFPGAPAGPLGQGGDGGKGGDIDVELAPEV